MKRKKKKKAPKLRQEVKVKVDIVTSDDIKFYYTGKFQDFTARYIIKAFANYITLRFKPFPKKSEVKRLQTTISNLLKLAESSPKGWKTLGKREQLLIMSNFSFSHNLFKRLVLQTS